jgi:phage-related protein
MADVIDVTMFTTQLQRELMDNVTPELAKITDMSKALNKAIVEGNIDVAVSTIGDDKVKKIATEMNASNKYFEKSISLSTKLRQEFHGINNATDVKNKLDGLIVQNQQRQAAAAETIKKRETEIIPVIQAKLQQAELDLSLMDLKDAGYKSQQDRVKSLTRNLQTENNLTADMIGQQQALTAQMEEQLKVGKKSLADGVRWQDVVKKINEDGQTTITNSIKQLEVSKKAQKVLDGMGEGQRKLLKESEHIIKEYTSGFDAIQESIMGSLGKLPLVGGMLQAHVKGPLEEATEKAKGAFIQSFIDAKEAAHGTGSAIQGIAAGMKSFVSGIAGMGKALIGALLNPFTLILVLVGGFLFLLKSAFDELSKIEDAAREFRFQFGMSAETSARLVQDAYALQSEFKDLGLYIEDWLKSGAALVDVFGSVHFVSKEATAFVGLMASATGVAEESFAGAMNNLMKLGAVAGGESEAIISSVQKLAEGYGLSFAKIMDDIANASEEALKFARGSAKAMASAAFHARRMGSSLDDVSSSAAALLDFETSITSQMHASTMFGQAINLSAMRRAAHEGDAKALLEERLKLMRNLGGLENMSRWQQDSLAQAMGTTVDQMYEMQKVEKQNILLKELANKKVSWAMEAQAKRDKADADEAARKNMSAADLAKLAEKDLKILIAKNKQHEMMTDMTNQLKGAWHDVKTALLPVAKELMPMIIELLNKARDYMKGFYKETEKNGEVTTELTAKGKELKKAFASILSIVELLGETLMWAFENPLKTIGLIIIGLTTIKFLSAGISAAAANAFGGGGGGGAGGTLFGMSPKTMMSAAFSLLLMAGAVYVFALALEKLKDVGLDELGLAIGGMATMLMGLFAVAQIMAAFPAAQLIQGAFAIALLGASLIPFAFAMNLLKDVGIGELGLAAAGITILGVAGAALGAFAPLTIAGAAALLLLSLAFIPLGFGLSLLTPLVEAFGKVFVSVVSLVVDAIGLLIDGFVRFAEVLGGFIIGVLDKVVQAIKAVGNVIIGVANTIAGIITSIGGAIASVITAIGDAISGFITSIAEGIAIVIDSVSGAITAMVDDITRLAEIDAGNLLAVAGALVAVGAAMAGFGVGSGVGAAASGMGNAVGALGNGVAGLFGADTEELNKSPLQKILDFADKADSIILVADKMDLLVSTFERLADMDDVLERAAAGLTSLGSAMASFGMGLAQIGIGNAMSGIGGAISGLFGGGEKQKDPLEQIFNFLDRLSGLDINTDALALISELNLAGFMGELPDGFSNRMEVFTNSIGNFLEVVKGSTAVEMNMLSGLSTSSSEFLNAVGKYVPKIKLTAGKTLENLAEGLDEFFESFKGLRNINVRDIPVMATGFGKLTVNLADIDVIPKDVDDILNNLGDGIFQFFDEVGETDTRGFAYISTFQEKLFPFLRDFAGLPIGNISEDVSSILNNLGDGIFQFFDELSVVDLTSLPFLSDIQNAMIPFLTAFAQLKFPAENADEILKNLGSGLEEFADFVNDGEGQKISKFFKASGREFTRFIEGMGRLSRVGRLSIVDSMKSLLILVETMGPETTDKLVQFSSIFVLKMNEMTKASDPLAENLNSITTNLKELSNIIEGLNINKLEALRGLIPQQTIDQVQKILDDNGTKGPFGPAGQPGQPGNVIVDFLPAKFVEIAQPTVKEFFLGEGGSVTDLSNRSDSDIQRDEQREKYFRKVYITPEEISKKIERQQAFLAEELAKVVGDPVGTNRIQHGVDLVRRDIAILEKIKLDTHPTTPSLADIFSTPLKETPGAKTLPPQDPFAEIFSTPPEEKTLPPQQSLAEIFSTPPEEKTLADIFSNPPPEVLEQTTAVTPNQSLSVGQTQSDKLPAYVRITRVFNALNLFTNESFISGITRATSTLVSFAAAVDGLSQLKLNILASVSKISAGEENLETGFNSTLSEIQQEASPASTDTEILNNITKSATQASDEKINNNTEVVKKLNELILLMRTGGVSVNMDGRKVSKRIAASHD